MLPRYQFNGGVTRLNQLSDSLTNGFNGRVTTSSKLAVRGLVVWWSMPWREFVCEVCGKQFKRCREAGRYCSSRCYYEAMKHGPDCPHWKAGRHTKQDGYVELWVAPKTTMPEHRSIVEKALGHPLPPGAVPHHWDENKSNNTPSNLVICQDHAYHMLLHARKRRLDDTGSLSLKRCSICREVKALSEFNRNKGNTFDGLASSCRQCQSAEGLRYYYEARAKGKSWALRHK